MIIIYKKNNYSKPKRIMTSLTKHPPLVANTTPVSEISYRVKTANTKIINTSHSFSCTPCSQPLAA